MYISTVSRDSNPKLGELSNFWKTFLLGVCSIYLDWGKL